MRGTVCVGDGWVVETGASVPRFGVALICLSVCLSRASSSQLEREQDRESERERCRLRRTPTADAYGGLPVLTRLALAANSCSPVMDGWIQ